MRLDQLLSTRSSHGTRFDNTPPRRNASGGGGGGGNSSSALSASLHSDLQSMRREISGSTQQDQAAALTASERQELRLLRQQVVRLRTRVQQVEAELAQQQADFAAQRDLNPFGGLSQLRASMVSIHKQLGRGSFGVVYQGTWRGVTCAIKFINAAVIEELRQECKIMDSIDHPNIVRLYGVAVPDDDFEPTAWPDACQPPCLIMEYMGFRYNGIKCADFIEYLHAARADRHNAEHWIKLCGMLQGVARGLVYLHKNGVMHRDFKGTNLLLNEKGILKISDFGLAKLYTDRQLENLKAGGTAKNPTMLRGHTLGAGTYTHMAPEVMASGGTYDASADVFSFGIVLSEAVAHAEGEDIVDETRTPDFGIDHDKLLSMATVFVTAQDVIQELVRLAVTCCDLDPTSRPSAHHIVDQLHLIQIQYQSHQLRTRSIDASKQLFSLADVDGDGKLSYRETSRLTSQTDGFELQEDDYEAICQFVGAESSEGLTLDHVVKMYTEYSLGDPVADVDHLLKSNENKEKVFWYRG